MYFAFSVCGLIRQIVSLRFAKKYNQLITTKVGVRHDRQTILRMRESVTSRYFETMVRTIEKNLNLGSRLEKSLNSFKVLEKCLIFLLGLEKSLKLTNLFMSHHFLIIKFISGGDFGY